ncbi:TIGR01906 family membrane protein [Micrococcus endophyticus]|uniref:TIGR01906 family membrane protein n=2 Tax=Micrococcus TaxID=1269 RepID=UPI0035A885E9
MASHQAGRGREERAGAEDFESGLDYGAFAEDDAAEDPNRTQALPASGRDDAGVQHTSALSPEDLAALRGGDAAAADGRSERSAERGTPDARERDIVASRAVPWSDRRPLPGADELGPLSAAVGARSASGSSAADPADRYPQDASAAYAASSSAALQGPTPEERARLPKAGPRVAQVLLAILAPLALLLAAVRFVASPAFLWLEYHRPGFPADRFGFDTGDRMHYGSAGLDYVTNLAGSRYLSSLTHQGEPLFTEAEVSHMTDVKVVLWIALAALVALVVVCALLIAHLLRTSPGGVRRALFAGALWLPLALIALAVLAVLGWETFFAGFHSLFFADGTWTFSARDALIRLYPEQFWVDAALVVGAIALIASLVTLVFTWPTRRRREMSADRRGQLLDTRLRWAREEDSQVR